MCNTCEACPFSFSEKSEYAQGLGCLPAPYDIMKIKSETGKNWACHEDQEEKRLCAGYVAYAKEQGVDYKTGGTVGLSIW